VDSGQQGIYTQRHKLRSSDYRLRPFSHYFPLFCNLFKNLAFTGSFFAMRRISFLLIIIAFGWAFKACKPMPNDGIPVYLTIDSVILETDPTQQGSNSHKIVDVWMEVNSTNLGVFETPVQMPILEKGELRFVISAGVLENAGNNTRVKYPFYLADTFTITNAVPGEKYNHTPTFRYRAATDFAFNETFDNGSNISNMGLAQDSNVFEGFASGHLVLAATDSAKQAESVILPNLNEGQEIWVEINYKSNVPFYVGINGLFTSGSVIRVPKLFVLAKPNWNKLYIKFSNEIGSLQADAYTLYFEALRPYGQTGQGDLYLDNIKVVQF
jgi:hypothetical protein